jgi:hypothetical protein
MDENYIFRRKPEGNAEIANTSSTLSPKHRRCLLLVDGRNTVRDLASYFRPGELAPVLRDLVAHGFVEAPDVGIEAIEIAAGKIAFIDDARFVQVQQRAMMEIMDRLGPAGNSLAKQIGACARPEQLRIALRSVEKGLQTAAGADWAKEFVKRVGRELMGS